MRNALHELRHKSVVGRRIGLLPILIVGILAAYAIVNAAAAPSAQTSQEPAQAPPPQARETGAALQQHDGAKDDQARVLLADAQALHERMQSIQKELDGLTTVGPGPAGPVQPADPAQELRRLDAQIQQMNRQRAELAQTVQQLETQLQQLSPSQEAGRRWLQGEVSRIQGQLRSLDEQLTEVRRQRLRADYAATLQAQPPASMGQEPTSQPAVSAPQTAQQIADLSAQLKQLQDLTQRNQRELEQLQDKDGPRARELEASLDGVRRQVQTIEERLRTMERTQAMEKLQAADRQRLILESRVQDLGHRQEELNKSVETIGQDLRSMQDQMRQTQQARAAGEESARRIAQQGVEQLRTESLRQQEELRNQMRSTEERLKVATERTGTGTEAFRKEFDSLRADLQRMGQTIGRLEREKLDAQAALKGRVWQLESQVSELGKDLTLVQGSLNMLLSQMGRSTVGSAGYPWGW